MRIWGQSSTKAVQTPEALNPILWPGKGNWLRRSPCLAQEQEKSGGLVYVVAYKGWDFENEAKIQEARLLSSRSRPRSKDRGKGYSMREAFPLQGFLLGQDALYAANCLSTACVLF
ncbi:hypothetical protein QYF36_003424 [Acer negundo]|nr:hypothetical protein QYF36_003424 [Acer negundo]